MRREIALATEALQKVPRNPYRYDGPSGKHIQWESAASNLKKWLPRAKAYFADHCPPRTGTTGGSGGSVTPGGLSNVSPKVEPPVVTEAKAGVAKEFTATASDADGQVTSWKWDWGDGTSTTGSGDKPGASHTYSKPGIYEIRVTVTDDKGASTTSEPEYVDVSAAGSKNSDAGATPQEEEANKDFEFECPPMGFIDTITLDVRIPSYAESPEFKVEPQPMCVGASVEITSERITGNNAGVKDAWGEFEDTYRVTIKITGAGAGGEKVHPVATVTWK